jgi:hypothetical protein
VGYVYIINNIVFSFYILFIRIYRSAGMKIIKSKKKTWRHFFQK